MNITFILNNIFGYKIAIHQLLDKKPYMIPSNGTFDDR